MEIFKAIKALAPKCMEKKKKTKKRREKNQMMKRLSLDLLSTLSIREH